MGTKGIETMISNFEELRDAVDRPSDHKLAVAAATDPQTLAAVDRARELELAEALLIGDTDEMEKSAEEVDVDLGHYETRHVPEPPEAALAAVEEVSAGKASVFMKGYIHTSAFLRAALDGEVGLRTGHTLSHVFVLDAMARDRLLYVTDGALNIDPELKDLAQIISNAVSLAHSFGNSEPNVGVLSAVAAVKPSMQSTVDAASLSKMADRDQIADCQVDGPFALDNAVNPRAAEYKEIHSPVAGEADILVVPDCPSGNMLAKSFPHIAGGELAGLVVGGTAPIVLPSRADTLQSKLMGIVAAVVQSQSMEGDQLDPQTVHF